MTAPETPRERALRLWVEFGYSEAAADAADAADDHVIDDIDAAMDAYEAGWNRYRKEHP